MAELWPLLTTGAVVLLSLVGLAVLADRPGGDRRYQRLPRDPERLRAVATELAEHAVTAQANAGRAAAYAIQARSQLSEAELAREDAWEAQEAAERAFQEAWQAVLAGRQVPEEAEPATGKGDDDAVGVDRERTVARAALAAYRRGDISVRELREVFRRSGAWNPEQEERERAADRRRVQRAAARRVHDQAVAAVRRAERMVRVAEVAAQALHDEAVESAVEAHEALLAVEHHARRRRLGRRPPRPREHPSEDHQSGEPAG